MQHLIKRVLDNQLQDFKGLRAAGRVVLADELVNELLGAGLQAVQRTSNTRPPVTSEAELHIDPVQVISWLSIDRLQYKTEAGNTALDFEVTL